MRRVRGGGLLWTGKRGTTGSDPDASGLTPPQHTLTPHITQGADLLPASPADRAKMRLLGEMWQASGVGNYWGLLQVLNFEPARFYPFLYPRTF